MGQSEIQYDSEYPLNIILEEFGLYIYVQFFRYIVSCFGIFLVYKLSFCIVTSMIYLEIVFPYVYTDGLCFYSVDMQVGKLLQSLLLVSMKKMSVIFSTFFTTMLGPRLCRVLLSSSLQQFLFH